MQEGGTGGCLPGSSKVAEMWLMLPFKENFEVVLVHIHLPSYRINVKNF